MTTVRNTETGLREQACDCTTCHYCGCYLAPRHEHDHFPVPATAGGTHTVPACINCHELKDRAPLHQWNVGLVAQGFLELMKVAGDFSEAEALRDPRALANAVGDHQQHWWTWSIAGRLVFAKLTAGSIAFVDSQAATMAEAAR